MTALADCTYTPSVPDSPQERDVKASGVRLRVTEAGEGRPVLLLHSVFFDRRTWLSAADTLQDGHRVIVPDLPGFGDSEKPSASRFPYTVEAFAHAIADLYAGLNLGPSCIVGHGLGGAIGITLAARYPELVNALVLVDAQCHPANLGLPRRLALLPVVGGFAFKQVWGRTAFRSYFRERIFSPEHQNSLPAIDDYYASFNPPAARASAFATLQATRDTRAVIADTARVQSRTLVIWGQHDTVYPAHLGNRLARDIRGAGFELLNTGHAPQEEQPELLARRVRQFLKDETRQSRSPSP